MMAAIAICVAAIPILNYKPKTKFNSVDYGKQINLSRWHNDLNIRKPEIVFWGNSMLRCGFNDQLFTKLTGKRTAKYTWDGSASAIWYLFLKNVILGTEYKPQKIVLFFRDDALTLPQHRTTGEYAKYVKGFSNKSEPVLDLILYNNGMSQTEKFLLENLPFVYERNIIRDNIEQSIRGEAIEFFTLYNHKYTDMAITNVFDEKNMDPELTSLAQIEAEKLIGSSSAEFEKQLSNSFLPYIIELAQKNDIDLFFVRVRRRIFAEGESESETMKTYMADLNKYLAAQKVTLLDYTDNKNISLSLFGPGDHLTVPKGQNIFTEILARDFNKILKKQ